MHLHVLKETKSFRCGLSLVSAAVFCLSSFSGSAQAASNTATATAEVIQAITIENKTDLRFGSFIPSTTSNNGTVVLGFTRTCNNDVTCFNDGSPIGPAHFEISGQETFEYVVSLPDDEKITVKCKSSSPSCEGSSMKVNSFLEMPINPQTFSGTDPEDLWVGATLEVAANQDAGEYEGSFNIKVTYQ